MTQRSLIRWVLLVAPAIAGVVLGVFIGQNKINQLYELAIRLNALSILTGIIASVLIITANSFWNWHKKEQTQIVGQIESEADKNRLDFLKRLDHELKNPITALQFGLSNIESSQDDTEKESALRSVKAQADRLTALVTDIRKLAELNTVELDREEIDLSELLTEVHELIADHPEASSRQISLSIQQTPWPLPKIQADWDLVFLAIYNLLENAVKFTIANDSIEIRAREASENVIVEVADTGPGIDESDFPHVWEDLYRGSRTRSISGSGLGLSLVKAIAEKHGGSVSLVSQASRGSAFSFVIPIRFHNVTEL